jgi:translocation and assembly module TamB
MERSRTRRIARTFARTLAFLVAGVLLLVVAALLALETAWAKDSLRGVIVRQANRYLTATLELGALEGSLFRGVELRDVRLVQDGEVIVAIDRVTLSYSIRELMGEGVTLRRLRVERPRVVAARRPDGRWNLAALVRREAREQERRGPGRPIRILSIEVVDGDVMVRDPLNLGFARAPSRYQGLNTSLSFDYQPVEWRLDFSDASWSGGATDLTMNRLRGVIANGDRGLVFDDLYVDTPRSALMVNGRVIRAERPARLDLHVKADRFAFQEWAGQVGGLRNIAVESAFDVTLRGPLDRLATDLTLRSDAGDIAGNFVLDTTVPGSHGAGAVQIDRLNLAKWLSRPDRPSDITGRVAFDLDLQLGRRGGFPRGPYTFEGSRANFMDYAASDLRARGRITDNEAIITEATAIAYGASVSVTDGAIGISTPYPYRFEGVAERVDLRDLPRTIPVPHVESALAFKYVVSGRFANPVIRGRATFADSEFLGARILAGATGAIDTTIRPLHYRGQGPVVGIDLPRFARELDIGWLRDPRYAGTISGNFQVEATGADPATMTLAGGGHLTRANLFGGTLSNADVFLDIEGGSLGAAYIGRFDDVNPALAFDDARFDAKLNGRGTTTIEVPNLFTAEPDISAYSVSADLELRASVVRGIPFDTALVDAELDSGRLSGDITNITGPAIEGTLGGELQLTGDRLAKIVYDITRADAAVLGRLSGRDLSGRLSTKGQAAGPLSRLQVDGEATVDSLDVSGVRALTASGKYAATIDIDAPEAAKGTFAGSATFIEAFGQELRAAEGRVAYDHGRLDVAVSLTRSDTLTGTVTGLFELDTARRQIAIDTLQLRLAGTDWRLEPRTPAPTLQWDDDGIAVTPMSFVDGASGTQQIEVSGTWRDDGRGRLQVNADRVFIDSFAALSSRPRRFGGVVELQATISGTTERPIISGQVAITDGRIERLSYERLAGRVEYAGDAFTVDLRFDQAPGVWLTAAGNVPAAVVDRTRADGPLDLEIRSSAIGLGLLEALTNQVTQVAGVLQVNMRAVGTSRDPHFVGVVQIDDAAFTVAATGVPYRNGSALFDLASDRVTVERFRLEDVRGRTLELRGSLATHELKLGDLEIDATARDFTVLRNAFGVVQVNADLNLRGRFEQPRVFGAVTVTDGELNVNEILDRTLFRPYATEETAPTAAATGLDPLAMLNPWQRLGLDVAVGVPNTLRMTGENVQIATGTPLGLSSFNLRVIGDLYLYKDPGQPLYPTGSFDSVTGSFAFQGRRFDIDPSSSINFRAELTPEVYLLVSRVISGVQTRITIAGPLSEPELRLASTPPLESSDILSLIVFGTSTNQLNAEQQRELAVRAGTLAAGFLATPLMAAIERTLGLEILEIEAPNQPGAGARVTIGDELAPGLVARFSRQFGQDEYDEATIEYQLSRIFRIRATFSDAGTLITRSPFRRVERAGIDFLVFFSF